MKTIIFLIICFSFFITTNAQTSASAKTTKTTASHKVLPKNCVKMVDGIVMVVKDGVTTSMSSNMSLKNGTMIFTDGSIVTKAGKKFKLKNGQYIDMKGKISHI